MFTPYLWSKRTRDLDPDFSGLITEDYSILTSKRRDEYWLQVARLKARNGWQSEQSPTVLVMGSSAGNLFVGAQGRVERALPGTPYGREATAEVSGNAKGREIFFIQLYFIPIERREKLPSLESLMKTLSRDLQTFLTEANHSAERVTVRAHFFAQRLQDGSVWDKYASELEKNKYQDTIMLFLEDGAHLETLPFAALTPGPAAASPPASMDRNWAFEIGQSAGRFLYSLLRFNREPPLPPAPLISTVIWRELEACSSSYPTTEAHIASIAARTSTSRDSVWKTLYFKKVVDKHLRLGLNPIEIAVADSTPVEQILAILSAHRNMAAGERTHIRGERSIHERVA